MDFIDERFKNKKTQNLTFAFVHGKNTPRLKTPKMAPPTIPCTLKAA
jgi:hypothetical protein